MSLTFDFAHSAEDVFELFTDPDFLVDRSLAIGELSADAEVAEDEDGVVYVTMRREVSQDLPAFLAKLFNPKQVLNLEETWTQDGDTFVGNSEYTVEGQPVNVKTQMQLTPNDSGCTFSITYNIKADIPLIKGKVEKFIKGNCEEGTKKELDFAVSRLG
jgi:hypothetical protein